MNYILYLKEFLFPRLGPIETHMFFVVLCIGSMIWKQSAILTFGPLSFTFADLVCIVGGIPMYFEMIRLEIQLFRRLKKQDEHKEE